MQSKNHYPFLSTLAFLEPDVNNIPRIQGEDHWTAHILHWNGMSFYHRSWSIILFLLPSVLVLVIATGAIYYMHPIGCSHVSRWSLNTSIEWEVSSWLTQVWEHHNWLWIHAFRWHWTAYVKAARSWRRRGYHGEVWNMTAVPLGRSCLFALHNELEWKIFLIIWKSISWIHLEFPLAMIYARSIPDLCNHIIALLLNLG